MQERYRNGKAVDPSGINITLLVGGLTAGHKRIASHLFGQYPPYWLPVSTMVDLCSKNHDMGNPNGRKSSHHLETAPGWPVLKLDSEKLGGCCMLLSKMVEIAVVGGCKWSTTVYNSDWWLITLNNR